MVAFGSVKGVPLPFVLDLRDLAFGDDRRVEALFFAPTEDDVNARPLRRGGRALGFLACGLHETAAAPMAAEGAHDTPRQETQSWNGDRRRDGHERRQA